MNDIYNVDVAYIGQCKFAQRKITKAIAAFSGSIIKFEFGPATSNLWYFKVVLEGSDDAIKFARRIKDRVNTLHVGIKITNQDGNNLGWVKYF